ncbi:hypothetical protein G6N82_03790 [Altererythrobacter sp. BO-6]|uniref:hypothetical protein n=1 Tax=Altererythrobacter sp. BO-6 TaxID=2604537 RepID=UPI0013E1C045|nr:hypothetical protein [Altererythrobacter sp. BO-6]QIG53385.1 hypothetical protein G6N82_03790 [Altererythrobacter sp. BO-6]
MKTAPTDWRDLLLAGQPLSDEDIQLELEDLAKEIVPPKVDFARLRKSILYPALLDLGFQRQGTGFCREIGAFMASLEVIRDKSNRAFRIDLGFHPLAIWDPAANGEWPATTSLLRGSITFPGGLCWWKHGLDEAATRAVLQAAASYLRTELLLGLEQVVAFCESASPSQLADIPPWLDPLISDAVCFARYRHAAGRKVEAAEFAQAALAAMPPPGPLAHLQPPRPIELEMRRLAGER